MDRRIAKTRKAIFAAFDALIVRTDYSKISVQNIIDQADIGRSTFYEHFETKDECSAPSVQTFSNTFLFRAERKQLTLSRAIPRLKRK